MRRKRLEQIRIGYLGLCVCHCRRDYARSKYCHRDDLSCCISLSPHKTNEHGRHASTTAQNNVDGDRDIIAESEVIEEVDGKEKENVWEPPG